jgi:hypothetical protein
VLAGYTPVLAFLTRDDSWLFSLAVTGMVGYTIMVDDYLRRRAARLAQAAQTATRDRPEDDPGSMPDQSISDRSMD